MARKFFLHKVPHEITFRTQDGLPLVATDYMKLIVKSIIARAQTFHPLTIVGIMVMSNHIHMIVIADDPGEVHKFVCYIKKETSHAINKLLGRRRRTVWCRGYDSPPILDGGKLVERLVYLYTNPQEADLEDRIEKYPNYSTWDDFLAGGSESSHKRITRDSIPELPKRSLGLREQETLAADLLKSGIEEYVLTIEPDAWLDCYSDFSDADSEALKKKIIDKVRSKERFFDDKRLSPVVGAHALKLARMDAEYTPKKFGKKMLCLGSIRAHRADFISWIKRIFSCAPVFNDLSNANDYIKKLPPGLFAPGGELNSNIIPAFIPIPI